MSLAFRPKVFKPTPKSPSVTQLSAEVDEIIESVEQLPIKSLDQERIFFKKFDQDSLCATIAMLAKTYSPGHVHKPPTLAIEYQPRVNKSAEAGATPSKERDASDTALGSPPPTRTETSEQPRAMSPEACTQSSDREAAASAFVCRPPTSGITPCLSHDCPDHCLFMYEPTQPEESGTGDNSFNDPISKNVKRESNSKLVHVAHPNVTPVSQSIVRGVQNLLAIAAESNITFKEDETMKAAVVETELQLAKTERGHVTGAQSTLSPAAAESPENSPSRYGFPPRTAEDHLHLSPRRPPAAHYSHQVNSQVRRQTQLFRCPPLLSCHESPFLWTSWISSKESLLTLRSPLSTILDQPPLLPRSFTKQLRGGVDH